MKNKYKKIKAERMFKKNLQIKVMSVNSRLKAV